MTPWLQDADVTLYHGDVLAVLPELPAESVDCVVTSPPYWGLRDYGTGEWEGGDAGCDHAKWKPWADAKKKPDSTTYSQFRDVCDKCGATRIDQQLGLEPTPEQYVERMVEVFREVRRVLAPHGTVWLNLGDSYATRSQNNHGKGGEMEHGHLVPDSWPGHREIARSHPVLKEKDLVGIPWRVAFALQADGWYLRSDIIWSKPNPMPESVTDRPTKAHEYVFLLSKQPRYFFDQEAVREPAEWARWGDQTVPKYEGTHTKTGWMQPKTAAELQRKASVHRSSIPGGRSLEAEPSGGRNIRSVWEIATQPYPEAHFATFPEELARRCIAAGCPEQVCRVCGKERERVVEYELVPSARTPDKRAYPSPVGDGSDGDQGAARSSTHVAGLLHHGASASDGAGTWTTVEAGRGSASQERRQAGQSPGELGSDAEADSRPQTEATTQADHLSSLRGNGHRLGPCSSCGGRLERVPDHERFRPGVTLDPFMGSGTVAHVARKLGRHAVGIDLNESYLELAARRLQQQSLFADVT